MLDGKKLPNMPTEPYLLEKCEPIYMDCKGWPDYTNEEWTSITIEGYQALPEPMIKYIQKIEEYLGVPVILISLGPERDQTIELQDVFG
jgi:adenylosuccinate synthase